MSIATVNVAAAQTRARRRKENSRQEDTLFSIPFDEVFKTCDADTFKFCNSSKTTRAVCESQGIFKRCDETFELSRLLASDVTKLDVEELSWIFHEAMEGNHIRIVELMLKLLNEDIRSYHNNIQKMEEEGGFLYYDDYTLNKAIKTGKTRVIRILLEVFNVDPTFGVNFAIKTASMYGRTDIVEILFDDGRVDPAANHNEPIQLASSFGHTDTVATLLKHDRVDPSARNNKAIRLASQNGHANVVELLLKDPRVNPAIYDNDPIGIASKNGHADVVELLLKDGRADPRANNNFALQHAQQNGHADVVALLLKDPRVRSILDLERDSFISS